MYGAPLEDRRPDDLQLRKTREVQIARGGRRREAHPAHSGEIWQHERSVEERPGNLHGPAGVANDVVGTEQFEAARGGPLRIEYPRAHQPQLAYGDVGRELNLERPTERVPLRRVVLVHRARRASAAADRHAGHAGGKVDVLRENELAGLQRVWRVGERAVGIQAHRAVAGRRDQRCRQRALVGVVRRQPRRTHPQRLADANAVVVVRRHRCAVGRRGDLDREGLRHEQARRVLHADRDRLRSALAVARGPRDDSRYRIDGHACWRVDQREHECVAGIGIGHRDGISIGLPDRRDGHRQGREQRRAIRDGGGDGGRVRHAEHAEAVAQAQLRDITAPLIGHERRRCRRRAGERGGAIDRPQGECPLEGDRVAIGVERAAAIEQDGAVGADRLVGARIRDRRPVDPLRNDHVVGQVGIGLAAAGDVPTQVDRTGGIDPQVEGQPCRSATRRVADRPHPGGAVVGPVAGAGRDDGEAGWNGERCHDIGRDRGPIVVHVEQQPDDLTRAPGSGAEVVERRAEVRIAIRGDDGAGRVVGEVGIGRAAVGDSHAQVVGPGEVDCRANHEPLQVVCVHRSDRPDAGRRVPGPIAARVEAEQRVPRRHGGVHRHLLRGEGAEALQIDGPAGSGAR